MTVLATRGRKAFAAALTAATLGVALAPAPASAGGWHGHGHHGHGFGYGAAGFGAGLLLGAIAASPRAEERVIYERRCWTERRRVVNAFGDSYLRRIRVCD
ncbi:hypothetical protein [Hansschlegelia sp. KR7-227]|uniref:hypothetical protein n=1 Tax=Hansschlegelia sp. KR7-227 TaxID=3400914 RepID=UPI003C03395D